MSYFFDLTLDYTCNSPGQLHMPLPACAIPQNGGLGCSGGGMPPPEHPNFSLQWGEIAQM